MLDHLDVRAARRWGLTALRRLGEQRAELDEQNVFPVADADTGTNLYLTVEAAVAAADDLPGDADLPQLADAFARGALLGARGNSGVILSQLLRGWADALREHGRADAAAVRDAMDRAAEQAYAAVARPVEGTILTVARAAARSARAAEGATAPAVLDALSAAAREALEHTPEQLDVLARAGVVDAGAHGFVVLLDALADAASGRRPRPRRRSPARPRPDGTEPALAQPGPQFEVMYLLDAPDDAVPRLRESLTALGDAVVVVGGASLWNVHVHTDDVGPAVEAGVEAGRPHRIRVTHLERRPVRAAGATTGGPGPGAPGVGSPAPAGPEVGSEVDGAGCTAGSTADPTVDPPAGSTPGSTQLAAAPPAPVAVVAGAAGPGLARLFAQCSAHVVPTGPGRRPTTGDLLDAVRSTGAAAVVLLPNDPGTLVAAQAAAATAAQEGLRVTVLPTRAVVQGLAAVAVHDPHAPASQDLVRMAAAAAATRHGAVTVASREALTSAGWCHPGDALAVLDGDVVAVEADLVAAARLVASRLLSGGGELLTLVTGDDPGADRLAQAVADVVRTTRRDVEISVVDGGQPGYPLLLGLE